MDGDHWTPMGKYRLACVGETVGMIRLGSCFVSMCGAICQAEDSFLARDVFRDKSAHGCMTMQGGQLRAELSL